jgi:putative cardiolipin synthase
MRLRFLFAGFLSLWTARVRADTPMSIIHEQAAAHAGRSGAYVLDKGEEALIARAWLTDHAQQSIDVQYFIWSTDNIGILAAEALFRAADRGVRVRVIVDDLMLNVPPQSLLALAVHPGIDIRIYNPKLSVPLKKKLLNAAVDFRGINQRMHDKVFVVDGVVAITGGRNVAAEYYDFHHEYNFRDRDALVVGEVVKAMHASFERFWNSGLSVNVEDVYNGFGVLKNSARVSDDDVRKAYRDLHAYAASPENFAPEVRAAIDGAPKAFPRLAREMIWGNVEFISDSPGKNATVLGTGGGGLTTAALARLVESATQRIVIQSPYLVLSDAAKALFRKAKARGVRVRINTNSLASTDNLQAFSGYRSQRDELLAMGLEIYEYRPDPEEQRRLMPRTAATKKKPPVCGLHAKAMVVDSKTAYIGTFNLDPRSENLNTEVGVIIHDEALARAVESAIETDMKPGNSWNAARDKPDRFVPLGKRTKVRFWQLLPIKPLL